jgi:endonuclease/exonuclease/phosphatase (EEP) superfamily protein YafD
VLYAKGADLHPLLILKHPERVAAAVIDVAGTQISLFSVHASIIKGRVFPHLDVIFDELEGLCKDRSAVIGGDLNSARLCDVAYPGCGMGSSLSASTKAG